MLVTSWAFTVLRRCSSADGKSSGGSFVQAPGHLEDVPAGQFFRSSSSSSASASSAVAGIVDQRPDQAFFGVFQLPEATAARGRSTVGLPLDRRLADFGPDDLFGNPRLVGDPVGELVARGGVRNPAATVSILPRNCRRLSSWSKSSPAAAWSSRYSRYGRDVRSCSRYASPPVLPDERIGIFALVAARRR